MGIPIDLLTHSIIRGPNDARGTWVHPQVAVNLAQWCSPKFAVQVSQWVVEWAITGKNPMRSIPVLSLYDNEPLQKAMSITFHTHLSRVNGNFAKENAELCEAHSDWHWKPSQYKEWAKANGWLSKERTSGLAVLRIKEPPSVGAITTEKWALMSGASPVDARKIAAKLKEGFALIQAAGIHAIEMDGTDDQT